MRRFRFELNLVGAGRRLAESRLRLILSFVDCPIVTTVPFRSKSTGDQDIFNRAVFHSSRRIVALTPQNACRPLLKTARFLRTRLLLAAREAIVQPGINKTNYLTSTAPFPRIGRGGADRAQDCSSR